MTSRLNGVTNAPALRVTMQRTSAPSSRRRRTSAAALTAAMPPVTPRRTFKDVPIAPVSGSGLLRGGLGLRRGSVAPLDAVVEDLVHRHARRLAARALDLRSGAAHHLFRALRGQQD